MGSQPRLHHGRTECVDDMPVNVRLLELRTAAAPDTPHRFTTLSQIGLLPEPIQHLQSILKRRRIPTLRREAVPNRHDNDVAELRDPSAEEIVGRRVVASAHPAPAVELQHHRQFPAIFRGRRCVASVDDSAAARYQIQALNNIIAAAIAVPPRLTLDILRRRRCDIAVAVAARRIVGLYSGIAGRGM